MTAYDREKMRKDLKEWHIRYLKELFLENPFPISDDVFIDTEWERWLNRITAGKDAELQHLESLPDGLPDEVAEIYAEDVAIADSISNDMYAALCVHVWSRFEKTYKYCVRAWNLEAISKVSVDTHRISKVAKFFATKVQISLYGITNHAYVNAVRVLANCYKHSDGRYEQNSDKYPIDELLLTDWDIKEGQQINYLELPIKDILFKCGSFLDELLGQFRSKIENAH